jgi:hypothetical protein
MLHLGGSGATMSELTQAMNELELIVASFGLRGLLDDAMVPLEAKGRVLVDCKSCRVTLSYGEACSGHGGHPVFVRLKQAIAE